MPDFPTVMVILVAVSGLIWAFDAAFLAPRRRAAGRGAAPPSTVVEYAKAFFPVFLVVFVLRSFVVEPFRIPSNSMMPTLLTGDFILVNKFTYGIRLPVIDYKLIDVSEPERGDVVVFFAPPDPQTPFIKRIVGLPGDSIEYRRKVLYVNGEAVPQEHLGDYTGVRSGAGMTGARQRRELLDDAPHEILLRPGDGGSGEGRWRVPDGHYFVLGDNRDNSHDSRFWGYVPDQMLIGKAFAIWFNIDQWHVDVSRIGDGIR